MRNPAATIDALERKARDAAVSAPERAALIGKAAELRERYATPGTQASGPPLPPRPPRPPAPSTNAPGPAWHFGQFTFTTSGTNATATTHTAWVRMTNVRETP